MLTGRFASLTVTCFSILFLLVSLLPADTTSADRVSAVSTPHPPPLPRVTIRNLAGTRAALDDDDDEIELDLNKTANRDTVLPGQLLVYTIVIDNVGDDEAEDLELEDWLPWSVRFAEGSLRWNRGEAEYDEDRNAVFWEGELEEEESATITFDVTVEENVPAGTAIVNTAIVNERWQATATVTVIQPSTTSTPTASATTPSPSATATASPSPTSPAQSLKPFYLPVARRSTMLLFGEPNDSCSEAFDIAAGQSYYFLAEDRDDWYRLELPASGWLTVRLTHFSPAQGQVAVYYGESCSDVIFLANNGDAGREKTVELGLKPSGVYYIYVSNDGGFNDIDPYTLSVDYRP